MIGMAHSSPIVKGVIVWNASTKRAMWPSSRQLSQWATSSSATA